MATKEDLDRIYDKLEKMDEKFDKKFESVYDRIHINEVKVLKEMGNVKIRFATITGTITMLTALIIAYFKDVFHK